MTFYRKEIFEAFFKVKNYILGIVLTILLTTLLYGFIPVGYLAFGVFNFIQVTLVLIVLLINVEKLNYFQKHKKDYFYLNLFAAMIFFLIPIGLFIIALIFVYQILFDSAGLISSVFQNMPTIINWSIVNWHIVAYVFFINIVVTFTIFLIFRNFSRRALTSMLLLFTILILFTGGFFINYSININTLSEFGTKIVNLKSKPLIVNLFSWLNPFYWINVMSSTLFVTNGIFANYNEFLFSINDPISFFSIFGPVFFVAISGIVFVSKHVFFYYN